MLPVALTWPPEGVEWTFVVLFLVILIGPIVAERMRLPGLTGLLIGGLIVGPHALDLVDREGVVEALGSIGILFLMFMAGLELDLDDFKRNRTNAVRFGLLTFSIPILLGTAVALGPFDYGWSAAILFGSLWASHTLISYPIARQYGLGGDRAVSMAVSGTVITDTLALFVLALVVGVHEGSGAPGTIVVKLLLGLVLLICFAMLALPRVTRWFFAGLGRERSVRFVAALAAFMLCAFLAHLVGMEGIVGAFFAGLGLNRVIPDRSQLAHALEFYGSAVLIPFFLISTGMLIDPSQFTDPRTLGLAAGALAVVVIGKGAAAAMAGQLGGFPRISVAMVFSLSVGQAAATLAAVIVGLEAGIFEQDLVNASLVVVLVSVVLASVGAAWAAPRMTPMPPETGRLGRSILVPVTDDTTIPRARLAARLAAADRGVVLPIGIAAMDADELDIDLARDRLRETSDAVHALAGETETVLRMDDDIADAVVRAAAEHGATLVIAGLAGARVAQDRMQRNVGLLRHARVPVLVVHEGGAEPQRVLFALSADDLAPSGRAQATLAADAARRLAEAYGVELVVLAPDPEIARPVLLSIDQTPVSGYTGTRLEALGPELVPGDLVVLPGRIEPGALGAEVEAVSGHVAQPGIAIALAPEAGRDRGVLARRHDVVHA